MAELTTIRPAVSPPGERGESVPEDRAQAHPRAASGVDQDVVVPGQPASLRVRVTPSRELRLPAQVTAIERLAPARQPSPERDAAVARAQRLAQGYQNSTQIVLDSSHASGFVEMVDGWGQSGRLRPNDAAAAILRANAAVWSVGHDLASNAIAPRDFGVASWGEVTPERMMQLAHKRLAAGGVLARRAVQQYLASAGYRQAPLRVVRDGASVPLTEEPGFSGDRGVGNYLFAASHASEVSRLGIMRAAERSAIAVATGGASAEEGQLQVALALWRGDGIPRDSSQALLAAATAARVSIARADIVGTPTQAVTEASLVARRQRGEIAAYQAIPNMPGMFRTFTLRAPEEVARDVLMRANDPAFGLSNATRAAMLEIVGPSEAPGRELARRMRGEENARYWRTIGGEVVTAAAFATVSFGVGGVASGLASGLTRSTLRVAAANVLAQSATFTTLNQVRQGELRGSDYLRDAALFVPLAGVQYLGHTISSVARGTSRTAAATRQALLYGVAATGSTGVMVSWEMAERYSAGGAIDADVVLESAQRNAILTASVMGVGIGLSRAMPGFAPHALVAAVHAPKLTRPSNHAVDGLPAVAQPETVPDPVTIAELRVDGDRYRVRDDMTIVADSGSRYTIHAGEQRVHVFVASDQATGALYIYEPAATGSARFRRAAAVDFSADGSVGVVDGVAVTRLPNGMLIGPDMTPVGFLRTDGGRQTLAMRFGAVDAYTRSLLVSSDVLSPTPLPDGRVAHSSPSHFVTPDGRVFRSFAQDASGRRVVVDAEGRGYLVEADGTHQPITEAAAKADGVATGFQRYQPVTMFPLLLRSIRAQAMPPGLSPEVANLVRGAMSFNLAGMFAAPNINLRVRNGRLVQIEARGAREVAFDVDGRPVEVLPGRGQVPSEIAGVGPASGTQFTPRRDGGRTTFWQTLPVDGRLHAAPDGTHALLGRGSSDPPARTGVITEGTSGANRVTALLLEGELFQVRGTVQGHPNLVYARSPLRDGLFSIEGSGDAAIPVPARPSGTVRVVDPLGLAQRVYHDGEAYTVVSEPQTREQLADNALMQMINRAGERPESSIFARLAGAMMPGPDGTFATRPDLAEPFLRMEALRSELVAGRGPIVDGVLGRDGVRRVEEAANFTPSEIVPFVLAVQSDVPPPTRQPHDIWQPSAPFRPQRFGIFVDQGSTLRPATVGEVRAAFDRVVGPRGVAWRDLPRPDSVAIRPSTRGSRNIVIRRGSEFLEIPFGERPPGADPGMYPTDAQVVRWFRELPIQSFRGLQNIDFVTDTTGLASYQQSTGTVSFHAHPQAWRGGFADVIAGHEIAGHNIERGSPTLMRMLVLSAVLDRAHGSPHAARAYGELNPREYFATHVEGYVAGDSSVPQRWPHFDRVMGAVFTPDGRPAPTNVFRGAAQAVLPVALLAVIAAEREKPQ